MTYREVTGKCQSCKLISQLFQQRRHAEYIIQLREEYVSRRQRAIVSPQVDYLPVISDGMILFNILHNY